MTGNWRVGGISGKLQTESPQGLKPKFAYALTARLKPCPFKTMSRSNDASVAGASKASGGPVIGVTGWGEVKCYIERLCPLLIHSLYVPVNAFLWKPPR